MARRLGVLVGLTLLVGACAKNPDAATRDDGPRNKAAATLESKVKATGAKSADGKSYTWLCDLAETHLDNMISDGNISHRDYSQRSAAILAKGGTGTGEIVAYNCGFATVEEASRVCAQSWVDSPPHWTLMEPGWDAHCYGIKKASEGNCYYCIGLFGNGSF